MELDLSPDDGRGYLYFSGGGSGGRVSRAQAQDILAQAGSKPVVKIPYHSAEVIESADMALPSSVGYEGLPHLIGSPGASGYSDPPRTVNDGISFRTTYDNWMWGEGATGADRHDRTVFLVELTGQHAGFTVPTDSAGRVGDYITVYVSANGGQSVVLVTEGTFFFDRITEVRVWRIPYPPEPEPEPEEPTQNFWTNFRKCREIDTGPSPSPGSPLAGGGDSPAAATTVTSLPYSATLGAIAAEGAKWFNVTLSAGTYRFRTTDSPDPLAYNTVIVVGTSLEMPPIGGSDDVSESDLRSDLTLTLEGGTYFVAVLPGVLPVPAGAILKIEAL